MKTHTFVPNTYMLKVTYKPYGAGQTLLISISVIVNLYLHVTIINKIIYVIYIFQ